MTLKTDIKEAFRSLLTARQRSLLALIGIVIGIASVIGMVSIGAIVREESFKQFKNMGVDIVEVRKDYDAEKTRDTPFRLADILELKRSSPVVAEVAPFLTSDMNLSLHGERFFLDLMGVTGAFFELNKLELAEGRFITDLDEDRYFCVLGFDAAAFLQRAGFANLLGERFLFGERIYTVVGILKRTAEGGGMRPGNINMSMLTHVTTATRAFGGKGINSFLARVRGGDSVRVKGDIRDFFERRARLAVRVRTAEELIEQMRKNMRLFTLLLGAIGSISLLVGGIGVMNVMLISVAERRKEIGIRRALGAQREDIQAQFVIESVLLCLAGGLIGIVLGVGISYLFAYFSQWTFMLSGTAIIFGVGVATASGIFFGYYPARTASRLDPIAALRS